MGDGLEQAQVELVAVGAQAEVEELGAVVLDDGVDSEVVVGEKGGVEEVEVVQLVGAEVVDEVAAGHEVAA